MSSRRDQTKLAIVEALEKGPLSLFDLTLRVELPSDASIAYMGETVTMLVEEGYVNEVEDHSSSAGVVYVQARQYALSDLRAKLLPARDPVREGHEFEQRDALTMRYRRPTSQGADLDVES